MTKEQTKAAASVMERWAEGYTVKVRNRDGGLWGPIYEPKWDWDQFEYQVNPDHVQKDIRPAAEDLAEHVAQSMTPAEMKAVADLMVAWAERNLIQFRAKAASAQSEPGPWRDAHQYMPHEKFPLWLLDRGFEYRLKPKLKIRPWTEKEVPVGAIIRKMSGADATRHLIVCSSIAGLCGPGTYWTYDVLLNEMEYSEDGGVGWRLCGIVEEPQ